GAAHGDVASTPARRAPQAARAPRQGRVIRVALAGGVAQIAVSATGAWQLTSEAGESMLLRAAPGDVWTIERAGRLLRAVRGDGVVTAGRPAPLTVRALDSGFVRVGSKRYRGEIEVLATDSGLTVVNALAIEDYLRGVVPLEIGRRTPGEMAAIEVQAVAARSYAFTRVPSRSPRGYDVLAGPLDQVYGGVDAETALTDSAVDRTAGLVLTYGGRVVSAPYSSTCGGSTAAATELWQRTGDEPFLVRVSDRIPGTERYYCDPSPRFRWTRSYDAQSLAATIERYLAGYATVPPGGPGTVQSVEVDGHTPSGRVRALVVGTERRRYVLRGNDIRFVLRTAGGEILNSTYFSVEATRDRAGSLARLELRGAGNGHGVGMCQWGAIGRARAGQDFRTILQTYYPGTVIAAKD
ncbi:MAG: SpoIID/LytB domain-containing protein, partial [Gemmatimonadaceae bacterium]